MFFIIGFISLCSKYQEKNEAMELKDNEVMYLMWKDRQVTGYHKLWEVDKVRDRERGKCPFLCLYSRLVIFNSAL